MGTGASQEQQPQEKPERGRHRTVEERRRRQLKGASSGPSGASSQTTSRPQRKMHAVVIFEEAQLDMAGKDEKREDGETRSNVASNSGRERLKPAKLAFLRGWVDRMNLAELRDPQELAVTGFPADEDMPKA